MFPTSSVWSIVSQPFKRSQLGLFQGKTKQYGNNVPFSKHKTRRTWLPNVQRKRLFSQALEEDVRVKLTTRALRTIKKHGGLDNYVKKSRSDILGWEGMRIRLKIRAHVEGKTPKPVAAEAAVKDKGVADNVEILESQVEDIRRQVRVNGPLGTRAQDTWLGNYQRNLVKKALKSKTQPSAKQTIEFLEQRRKAAELNLISIPCIQVKSNTSTSP